MTTLPIDEKCEQILDTLVAFKNGQRREPQVALAKGMARHAESGLTLLAQGPTGVGKSLAAIAAARATGAPALIATHTHALQQQLQADAALLSEATGEFSYAVLKGRSAYYCHLRGQENIDRVSPPVRTVIDDWLDSGQATIDGGERSAVPADISAQDWSLVSATTDQCIGKDCPFYTECFYEEARFRAQQADITILNHAIVAQGIKQEGDFLGGCHKTLILDECHEFPSVLGEAFGGEVSSFGLKSFFRAAREPAMAANVDALYVLVSRGARLPTTLDQIEDNEILGAIDRIKTDVYEAGKRNRKKRGMANRAMSIIEALEAFLRGDNHLQVCWIEVSPEGFTIKTVYHNVGGIVRNQLLPRFHSVQFLSATVKIGDSFDSFAGRLGLRNQAWTGAEIAPLFDYENNSMVWLPANLKAPNDPGFARQVGIVASEAIRAAGGRTLILCTSWKNVDTISEVVRERLSDLDIPILTQERGRNVKTIAAQFQDEHDAVLIGTRTLWTGVSFDGDTCTSVILDKVPFPSPADPVIRARVDAAEAYSEGSGFSAVMVPEAILTIVQGAGRLIRTKDDKGVVILCDPRVNKNSAHFKPSYGARVMKSLPPMTVTSDTETALGFLRSIDDEARQVVD